MDVSPPSNDNQNTDEHELIAMLVDLRDTLTSDPRSLPKWQSRLEKASTTPHQIMHVIVPILLFALPSHPTAGNTFATNDTESLSSDDALNILGCLVTPSSCMTNDQASLYLEAASKVIRSELEKAQRDQRSTPRTLCVSKKFVAVLVHQACTGLNGTVAQNSHASVLLLHTLLFSSSSQDTVSFLWNEIVKTWSNAMQSIQVDRTGRTDPATSTICIRCATLAVDLAVQSDHAMQLALDVSALDLLLQLFQVTAGDPLLQLSVLDLFQTMASTRPLHPLRAQWLLSDAVTQPLLRAAGVTTQDEEEVDVYLQGPALRVLASICAGFSTAMHGSENTTAGIREGLMNDLLCAMRTFDVTAGGELDRLSFIDAVSSLAQTSSVALHCILDDDALRETWLNLAVAQPKLKSALLVSVAHVLESTEGGADVVRLTNEDRMKLYAALGTVNRGPNHSHSTELLLHLVGPPIPEIRFGVYRLFQAVARNPLGGQVLLTQPQFFDFLLSTEDRWIESTYDGRLLKFAIVEAIDRNATLQQLLSKDIVQQVQQCLARGPHYKKVLPWDVVTAEQ